MKILYIHPHAWTGEYPLLQELGRVGYEVMVLEEWRGMPGAAKQSRAHFREPGDGLRTFWYDPGRGWEKLLTWPVDRYFKRSFDNRNLLHRMVIVLRAVRYFRPDVVLCSEGFSYAIPCAFLRRSGLVRTPIVANYIGGDILDVPEAEVGKRRTPRTDWLIKQSLRGIDRFRPFSPLLREALLADGACERKIEVIPGHLVADADALQSVRRGKAESRQRVRARYGISDSAPVVVTLSNNQRGKGGHILAQAWSRICAEEPEARWLLCGPSTDWLDVQVLRRLRESGLAASVIASGRLSGLDVFEHLAAGDVHVSPTLCDGGPMVNIEAAAVMTPTLTTTMAGNSYWLREYGCGEVVPAGDGPALAAALLRLLAEPDRRVRMGSNGAAMTQLFSLEHVAGRLGRFLEEAAAGPVK